MANKNMFIRIVEIIPITVLGIVVRIILGRNVIIEGNYAYEKVILRGYETTSYSISMTTQTSVIGCFRECLNRTHCVCFSYTADNSSCRLFQHDITPMFVFLPNPSDWRYYLVKKCPDGWRHYSGSCYLFEDVLLETWYKAQIHCHSHGAYLVEIESLSESLFVNDVVSTLNESSIGTATFHGVWGFWLGGNDIDTEGTWTWSESGNPVQNISWKPNEPYDYGNEDCMIIIEFFDYQWLDYKCDQKENFICEKAVL